MRTEVIGDCTLILGDCLEVLPTLGKFDATISDPPYGVNLGKHDGFKEKRPDHTLVKSGYQNYDDTEQNLIEIVVPAISQSIAMSKYAGVFCAGSNIWHFPKADIVGGVYLPSAQGRNKWGFSSLVHLLLYGTCPTLYYGSQATAILSTESAAKNGHPVPKPLGWMLWAVSLISMERDIVCDPFMGSGTTGVACIRTGRKFIGIEIEPRYFDIACRRIQKAWDEERTSLLTVAAKVEQPSLFADCAS